MTKSEIPHNERYSFGQDFHFYSESDILIVDKAFAARLIRRPGKNLRLLIHSDKMSNGLLILSDKTKVLPSFPNNYFETIMWSIDNLNDTVGITINEKYLLLPQTVLTPNGFGMVLGVKSDHLPKGEVIENKLEIGEMDRLLIKI